MGKILKLALFLAVVAGLSGDKPGNWGETLLPTGSHPLLRSPQYPERPDGDGDDMLRFGRQAYFIHTQ